MTGQRVRFVDVGMPPPIKRSQSDIVQGVVKERGKDLHGYIHCMPYGKVPFGPSPNPFVSYGVPLLCRLLPLEPGYVMTV